MTYAWRVLMALTLSLSLFGPVAAADEANPDQAQAMVKDVTHRMLEVLRSAPSDAEDVRQRMEEIVAPHLDFITMTKLAVGRQWRDADDDHKRALVNQFRELLLRTYARSLQEYDNQKIQFLPLESGSKPGRATVRSRVIQSDGPEVGVDYSLRYHQDQWTVYDIVVDGVSLVTNYRPTFSTLIREQGFDGLIARLKKKNAHNEPLETGS